ncbi:MAG TPA: sulfatase family protein [Candidatus Wunengus sp. YC65]|uniref:sulfatase family protein n=1 Tax=Candidatus Wunengus sp. YC65 TaxID=3367701 RepID=UPI0040296111
MSAQKQLFVVMCFLILLFGFESRTEAKEDLPKILLFTVDACRPDHFGCYGYSRNTTPNIDKIASEGVLFTHAFSQSAWTTPGMISIFTSLYPPTHGVDAKDRTLKDDVLTLPRVLEENGYVAPVLPKFVDIQNYWHLGFDVVDKERFSGEEGEDLLKLLEAYKDQRFFIWYHYHGLHLPYNPQNPYDKIFQEDIFSSKSTDSESVSVVKQKSVIKNNSINFDNADKKVVVALYDGQVRQLDDYMGQLMERMKQWGIWDNTLIIITSDHGEELFEHGFIGHASTSLNAKLYDEIIHIPLIIWWPKKIKHRVVGKLVQQIDIMPTILDMLGIPPSEGLQGYSLLPSIQGKPANNSRPVFCETILGGFQSTKEMEDIRLRCVRTKEWKLIYTNTPTSNVSSGGLGDGKYELYNLRNDLKEEESIFKNHPEVARELKKKLFQWIETTTSKECSSQPNAGINPLQQR